MSADYRDSYSGMGGGGIALPRPTPVVKRLLIANFALFGLTYALWLSTVDPQAYQPPWFYRAFGLYAPWWGLSPPFLPVWQLFSYGFLHSVHQLSHILLNMLQLYFFGTLLEGIVGSRRFAAFFGAALVAGGLAQLVASEVAGSPLPTVGASGALLGVLVAAAVLRPNTMVILLFLPIALKWLAVGVVALDAFALLNSMKTGAGSVVAHWAHLGGAAFGFVAAKLGWVWLDPFAKLEQRRRAGRAERERSDEQRLDELLAKIKREGMSALTKREREFLKRTSARRSG